MKKNKKTKTKQMTEKKIKFAFYDEVWGYCEKIKQEHEKKDPQ